MAVLAKVLRAGLAGLLLSGALAFAAPAAVSREYQIKAVFLFNFAQFVDWPAGVFSAPDAPFVIGVLGDDPFGSALDEAVRGEKIHGHPLVIRRYRQVEEVAACHLLYLGQASDGSLDRILQALRGRQILTVGEAEGFARAGGMIRFVTEDRRIRFRINLAAARAAKLTLSSKLLRPADIVYSGQD